MKYQKIAASLCGLLYAFSASATDWYVSPDGTGSGTSPTDPGEAITTSRKMNTGDTLHFAPGTYNLDKTKSESNVAGSGSYFRMPTKSKGETISNLTFIGESDNPEDVRLIGTPADKMRIFYFATGGHVVRNLYISGGYTDYQGAGLCMADGYRGKHEQAFTASNCVVENCSAAYKGAVRGGVWRNCVIRNNTVRNTLAGATEGTGGGAYNVTLYDCVITNNVAGLAGGGLAGGVDSGVTATTKAYDCLIGWNRAPYGAGVGESPAFTVRTYCQLYNCTVVSNTASQLGGGAFRCTITNSTINGNYVSRDGTNTVDGTSASGGGVAFCDVLDTTLEGNICVRSGAGAAKSSLTRCRILNNTATLYGGGAHYCSPVKDCLLAGNKGDHGGAGFYGYFENCIMTNNTAVNAHGGATYNATSRNCIVVGNYAKQRFAHCRGAHYGDLVYGNKNGRSDGASGIGEDEANADEPLPVVNCTVWNNLNGNSNVSRASLTNSIVWSVTSMENRSAVNSFWRNGMVTNQTGCISGTDKDPKFVGINATQTATESSKDTPWTAYALRASSPCRDTGLTLPGQANEKDALGNSRVKYGAVDMGALECIQSLGACVIFR